MATRRRLAAANVHLLEQASRLIGSLEDPTFRGAIGPQVRHCLDFYVAFLAGKDAGRVDYDARERDPLVESSRRIARERIAAIASALERIDAEDAAAALLVRAEAGSLPAGSPEWSPSSLGRELQFLLSHTVHHLALIAEMLRARGRRVDDELGVSPSTLQHRAALACAQ